MTSWEGFKAEVKEAFKQLKLGEMWKNRPKFIIEQIRDQLAAQNPKHLHCGICGEEIRNIRIDRQPHPDGWEESFTVGDCKCGTNIHDFDGRDFCWCEK